MLFNSIRNLVLVKQRTFISKSNNTCTFLTLADPKTYESVDIMPIRGMDLSRLSDGTLYKAVLHYDGRYTSVELIPAKV